MENTNYLKTQHFSRLSKTATYRAMKSCDKPGRFDLAIEEAGDFIRPKTKPRDMSNQDR